MDCRAARTVPPKHAFYSPPSDRSPKRQYLQGLTKVDAEQMQKRLESARLHLWHGNTNKELELMHYLDADLHPQEALTK
ncbi:hypothetical protein GO730_38750 [Spirosoma sp. HMF3257]|uniref:Uncharacterized protein n=1 Tax=Spirosoma telluris TaxID=2183553 RepID=A0A327NFK8_9BACT|nr:hypothetical protein [Spirosoma telluris]RAI73039.1 hypothetical protein HMF3257_38675 [Spirosoma telluris]